MSKNYVICASHFIYFIFTYEQRAGFFGDTVDELGVLNDTIQQFLLRDGQTPRQVSLVIGAVQRDAQAEETRPE